MQVTVYAQTVRLKLWLKLVSALSCDTSAKSSSPLHECFINNMLNCCSVVLLNSFNLLAGLGTAQILISLTIQFGVLCKRTFTYNKQLQVLMSCASVWSEHGMSLINLLSMMQSCSGEYDFVPMSQLKARSFSTNCDWHLSWNMPVWYVSNLTVIRGNIVERKRPNLPPFYSIFTKVTCLKTHAPFFMEHHVHLLV